MLLHFLGHCQTILLSARESKGGNSKEKKINMSFLTRAILMIIDLLFQ